MALSGGLQITSANQQHRRPELIIAVGVDTHRDQHVAVALDTVGQLLGEVTIPTDLAGYRKLTEWLKSLEGRVLVGIEGAGSYGAGLCEYLQSEGLEVFEVERPKRVERRKGKSDKLDALLAAKKVLAGDGLSTPRGSGKRQALQILILAYRSVVGERVRLYNQLQAMHVTAPAALRDRIGPARSGAKLAQRLSGMRTRPNASLQENITLQEKFIDDQAGPHPGPRRAGQQLHQRNPRARQRTRPHTAGRARCRADLRRKARRVQPGTLHQRGSIRTRQRHRTTTSVLRQNRPSPPQPRRRPPDQHRDLHDRALTHRSPRPHTRLHATPNRRGQDQARGHALPQATPLTPPLQAAHKHALDNILLRPSKRPTGVVGFGV
jgi:hypothetical protein